MSENQFKQLSNLTNANFPTDAEGRVYHLAVKRGEVANRILSVGDPKRAQLIAKYLEGTVFTLTSKRGFVIHTGLYKGVPISIIATGMGFPMMDFVVRECRAVVDGPMIMVRLGTCGTLDTNIKVGSIVVASEGSILIQRDPDAWSDNTKQHYRFSNIVLPDADLSNQLIDHLKSELGTIPVYSGLNATADSFYSSQGRIDNHFDDKNAKLIEEVTSKHKIAALEMETFHLFDLARCSYGTIKAGAVTMVLAQRFTNEFLDNDTLHKLEQIAGTSILNCLANTTIENEHKEGVWNNK